MFCIYINSGHSTLKGYYTGKVEKAKSVPYGNTVRFLTDTANIPVVVDNINNDKTKVYKTKRQVMHAALALPTLLKEKVSSMYERPNSSNYYNCWSISVVDTVTGTIIETINSDFVEV